MLTHHNVISNILQSTLVDGVSRKYYNVGTQAVLGLLPFGHIFALTLVALVSIFRGDEVVVLPQFELESFLRAIQQYKIEQLILVPPVLVQMASRQDKCREYDLSSVRSVFSGAAPLGEELTGTIAKAYPKWHILQGYGKPRSG